MYVDAAYRYRPSSMVFRSVGRSSEPRKNSWTNRDAVWVVGSDGPRESCVRWYSRGVEGRCGHGIGNQFWDAICYNWLLAVDPSGPVITVQRRRTRRGKKEILHIYVQHDNLFQHVQYRSHRRQRSSWMRRMLCDHNVIVAAIGCNCNCGCSCHATMVSPSIDTGRNLCRMTAAATVAVATNRRDDHIVQTSCKRPDKTSGHKHFTSFF